MQRSVAYYFPPRDAPMAMDSRAATRNGKKGIKATGTEGNDAPRGKKESDDRASVFDAIFWDGPMTATELGERCKLAAVYVRRLLKHEWFVRQGDSQWCIAVAKQKSIRSMPMRWNSWIKQRRTYGDW